LNPIVSNNPIVYFVNEIKTSFVLNDIKRLAEKHQKFYLFSINKLEGKDLLPDHVLVYEEFISWNKFKPLRVLFRNFFSITSIYIFECIKLKKKLPFKKAIALLCSNIFKADCVIEILRSKSDLKASDIKKTTFYSFWFYDCIFLAWLKKKKNINKAFSRAHGGDLYEERNSLGKILFRNFQLNNLDFIFPVSRGGATYLQKKYPSYIHKVKTFFLGSHAHSDLSKILAEDPFVLVSCAKVRDIKRIHKIAEMLQFIHFKLKWYHLGDENLDAQNDPSISLYKENVIKLKNNTNIEFTAMGLMDNESILRFYKSYPVNLFISLSEAEGIPVSMMEAISFGIPILSTDVGGCNEIVNEKTGVLIPLETKMEEVASKIKDFKYSYKNTENYRIGTRKFWEENFNADVNYKDFFNLIEN
jgi:glycosyltransferase involved in cell wall biosynthesis